MQVCQLVYTIALTYAECFPWPISSRRNSESAYRRQGYASEAMQLLFRFATTFRAQSTLPINAENLVVRIGETNVASRRMFEKLGFVVTKHVKVFEELEMRLPSIKSEDISKSWIAGNIARYL